MNCNGKLIELNTPRVMGILNVTPDSFFDGGQYGNPQEMLKKTEKMLNDGATFIDVGAYSSRPNANFVSEQEELQRLMPIVKLLVKTFPEILLSIDTFRSEVAKQSIEAGACLINDISAGILDKNMLATVAQLKVPYIMMHMKGTPQTMKQHTDYDNLLKAVLYYFSERIDATKQHGINDIIIDPGFGFAKTIEQNYELLQKMDLLNLTKQPILAGISRKSMIYKTLNTTAEHALNGSTVLNTIALQKGASILRVHDVKEALECITLTQKLHV